MDLLLHFLTSISPICMHNKIRQVEIKFVFKSLVPVFCGWYIHKNGKQKELHPT